MNKILQKILIISLFGALWACDTSRVFDTYHAISDQTWHKDSLVTFHLNIEDTIQNHDLYVNIRNDMNYGYSNLWLFLEIEQPGGSALRDTFEIVLADPSGKWLGKGLGGLKTRETIYRRNVYFPVSGNYKVNVQHGMRNDLLDGICDVGFRVERIN